MFMIHTLKIPMNIPLDDLLKNSQMKKPECLTDTENFLKQTPHLPFFLQPLSPAEKICYQQKSLTFVPTQKQPVKKGFKWDKEVNVNQQGTFDKEGNFRVEACKTTLWLLEGSLVPYTTVEMERMRDKGELKGMQIKRVDDVFYIGYEELERKGGILTDERMDEIYRLIESVNARCPGEKEKVRVTGNKVVDMLSDMGCTTTMQDIEKNINKKTKAEAILYLEGLTKKSTAQCVELLNAICSKSKIEFAVPVEENGFKPVKKITRKK